MRQICVFLIVVLLTSCNYFDVKKTSSEAILNEELQTFNWNEVDVYPSFALCDSLESILENKACFSKTLTLHILNHLQKDSIVVNHNINDTINLQIQVSESGDLKLLNTKIDSLTITEIPNIKCLISNSLEDLPKIFPAIKRGQHVKTEFKLPIIIQVN
jgi:hypothetical protein